MFRGPSSSSSSSSSSSHQNLSPSKPFSRKRSAPSSHLPSSFRWSRQTSSAIAFGCLGIDRKNPTEKHRRPEIFYLRVGGHIPPYNQNIPNSNENILRNEENITNVIRFFYISLNKVSCWDVHGTEEMDYFTPKKKGSCSFCKYVINQLAN